MEDVKIVPEDIGTGSRWVRTRTGEQGDTVGDLHDLEGEQGGVEGECSESEVARDQGIGQELGPGECRYPLRNRLNANL